MPGTDSTDLLSSMLLKHVEQLLSTFAQTSLDVGVAPVRVITIRRNPRVRNQIWQDITKPHDLRYVGYRSTGTRRSIRLGRIAMA